MSAASAKPSKKEQERAELREQKKKQRAEEREQKKR